MRRVPRVLLLAALLPLASCARSLTSAALADGPLAESGGEPPLHLREVYLPFGEFMALAGKDPNGVVMELREYRELVLAASRRARTHPPPILPPAAATVIDASYHGVLEGRVARFEGALRVRVASEGWVRADLGPPLPALGKITVDGEPGWIIVQDGPTPPASRRAHLLLRGPGDHLATLRFSLPAAEEEERWSLEGSVVAAPAGRLELEVPGTVETGAGPASLEAVPHDDRTRLVLGLGNSERFKIDWRRKRTAGDQTPLLTAEHRLSWLPRRENPFFAWESTARVARRKTGELVFREPASATVLSAEGPLVHAWERTAAGIRVLLKEPVLGEVKVRFTGTFAAANGGAVERFRLELPGLAGAFSDTGHLAVFEPAGARVSVTGAESAVEVAATEVEAPPLAPTAGAAPARVFACRGRGASVTVEVAERPVRFAARSAWLARIAEDGAWLEGVLRVNVLEGRVHELTLSLPAPWRLAGLRELAPGPDHGLGFEERGPAEDRSALVRLGRSVDPAQPLDVFVALDHPLFGEDRNWGRRDLELALPTLSGAAESRVDLGVAVPPSMDPLLLEVPGWKTLSPQEISELALEKPLESQPGGAALVAGLTTATAAPRLPLTLVHRPPRGEYRAVSHVLAIENALRVRADVRVALLDRPVGELVFNLPAGAGPSAIVLGEGIKETILDAASGRRTVRFARPWLGTRQFRIEYETPHGSGAAVPVPSVSVAAGTEGRTLPGEGFLVLQSLGAVEIGIDAGPGLAPADVDELPDFASPWREGRVLTAHRFRPSGAPGTLRALVHERAPVLRSLAPEVNLATVIGRDGVSRTRAEVLLAHAREQYLRVVLPAGARTLGIAINGESIRAVRPDPAAGPAGAPGTDFSIPLPRQSYARLEITYEERGRELGALGTWTAAGPRFPGVAVGETTWSVYHPDGYRFSAAGGNAESPDVTADYRPLSALRGERPSGKVAEIPDLTPEEARGIVPAGEPRRSAAAILPPAGSSRGEAAGSSAPFLRMIPEGRWIRAEKLGGDPEVIFEYRSVRWSDFARRTVFLSATLLGLALALRGRRRPFWYFVWYFVSGGLFLGLLFPFVLGWRSPLFAVPLCEALVVLAIAGGIVHLARRLARAVRPAPVGLVPAVLLAAFAMASGAEPRETPQAPPQAPAQPPPQARGPDAALIPYDPASLGARGDPRPGKVYLPYEKFRELWNLAHGEERVREERAPRDLILGNAGYSLRVEGEAYRLRGTISFNVLTDRWVVLPLPFDGGQISGIAIDGVPAGVAQKDGVPFIEVHGRGARTLTLDLSGPVHREPGRFKVLCGLLAGPAASLHYELPPGATVETGDSVHPSEVDSRQLTVDRTDGRKAPAIDLDLGTSDRIELAWSFPRLEGETGSQVESRSYSRLSLNLDGYDFDRLERVRVGGRPVDALAFRILGGLQVAEVAGADVSEWSVVRDPDAAAGERLQVFLQKPAAAIDLRIRGRAALAAPAPLATLALAGAARVETFVGLHHSPARRFAADVLSGMRRASREEVGAAFGLPQEEAPDRIYQVYGIGEGERLAAAAVNGEAQLSTAVNLVVEVDRLVVSVRSRFSAGGPGPGPLRHQVVLPGGWTVRTVKCPNQRDWEIVPAGAGNRLVVHFAGRAAAGTEVLWTAERPLAPLAEPIEVPPLRAEFEEGVDGRETQDWVIAGDDGFELAATVSEGMVPQALEAVPEWLRLPDRVSARVSFRSVRAAPGSPAPRLHLAASRRPSQLSATSVAFARLSEDSLQVNARVIHRIRRSGRDRFRLRLPPGAELESADARNQRGRDVRRTPEGIEVEVVLQSPVTGEHAVDLSYRVPRAAGAPPVMLPIAVFDAAVADGRGRLEDLDQYVGVLTTPAAVIADSKALGLVPVEAESVPYLPEGVSAQNLRPTYRATQLDWSLTLREEEVEVREELPAVIEFAEISTVIGGDGTARTRAVYTVRNRRLQFLEVELPEGAELWGVTLNGKAQAVGEARTAGPAGQAQGRVLWIPVERVGAAGMDLEVALNYAERSLDLPAGIRARAMLAGPRVRGVQVVETAWSLQIPDGYRLSSQGSNLREVPPSARYARKVTNLLEQLRKIRTAAGESDSHRVRNEAARELARLELALGDNLSELESTSRSPAEQARAGSLGEDDVRKQWADNDRLIRESEEARKGLREAREAREKKEKESPPQDPARPEQSFEDATNYLRRGWRGGRAQKRTKEAPAKGEQGALSLRDLLERSPFGGLSESPPAPRPPDHEFARAKLPDGAKGLAPLAAVRGAESAPGLEVPEITGRDGSRERGGRSLLFLRQGGDPELRLTFTRSDALPRLGALCLLIAAPAALLLRRKRRGSSGEGR